jgi:putative flippase GtrA
MKTVGFLAGGAKRTYWDFYLGFGLAISAYLVLQAIVLWQVAGLVESEWAKVKPNVASFAVAFVVNALIVWQFFFALPLVLALAVAGCLAAAAFSR